MLNSYILIKNYELCSQMGHLIGPSGVGKAKFFSSYRDNNDTVPCTWWDEIQETCSSQKT